MSLGLVALMGLMGGQARAGTLTAVLSWGAAAGDQLTVTGSNGFGTTTVSGGIETLMYNVGAINAYLSTHSSGLTFQAGSGLSDNQPSGVNQATLTSTGQVNVTSTGTGSTTMSITAYLTDYTSPMPQTTLSSTNSATFAGTATGDSTSFTSWYNSNNVAPTTSAGPGIVSAGPITTTVLLGGSGTNPTLTLPPTGSINSPLGFSAVFSLTNMETISLTRTGNAESATYGGQTVVTGIPEPASIVMMLTGIPMPLVVLGMLRRRKAAKKS
jgi:hypothetical protein